MSTNNKKNTNTISFEEKVQKEARRQKQITRVVCLILAALMVLGGATGILVSILS